MTRTLVVSTLLTPLLCTAPAAAQAPSAPPPQDAKWSAYVGCWRDVDDPAGNGARVCVTPDGAGVRVSTIVAGQRVREEVRVADGIARPVDANGCRGTETVRWSAVGQRVYRRAEVACDSGEPRTLSTASYFVAGPIWVDIETVDHDGATNVRVSRLVRAANQQLPDGTTPGATAGRGPGAEAMARFSVADVIDLSTALPPDGVQAAIAEAPTTFRLNAAALTQMADAHVGPRVIDLMVGLTYPQKFQVSRLGSGGGGGGGGLGMLGMGMSDPFFAGIVGPAAFNCYSPYGWAQASYWGSCNGYDPYMASMYPGYYNGYWGAYGPGWVVTQPGLGTGGPSTPVEPQGNGRLVNGRGYTQVQPVVSTGAMTADGSSRSSGNSSGGSSNGGGSNAGVSSSGGYSGGGMSSGGGDRTAVPRGPGGQ